MSYDYFGGPVSTGHHVPYSEQQVPLPVNESNGWPLGLVVTALGAILLIVGSLTGWIDVSVLGAHRSASGVSIHDGIWTLVAGIVVLVLVTLALAGVELPGGFLVGAVVLLAVVAVLPALYDLSRLHDAAGNLQDAADQAGPLAGLVESLKVSAGTGLWCTLVAAPLTAAGGIWTYVSASRR